MFFLIGVALVVSFVLGFRSGYNEMKKLALIAKKVDEFAHQ